MKVNKQGGNAAIALLSLIVLAALVVGVAWGWITNVFALVHHVGPNGLLELLRIIGIFVFPLGILLGWFA